MSGIALPVLKYALPELCTSEDQRQYRVHGRPTPGRHERVGCPRCIGNWHSSPWVRFWARQEDVICPSHWVWTGTTSSLDLSNHPKVASEVITANRRHRRLIRRRGRLTVRAAYYDAKRLCREWNKIGIFNKKISRRLTDILGPKWSVRHDDPESEAAYYPNVIELTQTLSSPYWRSLILDEHLPASPPREPLELLGVPADFYWLMEHTRHRAIRPRDPKDRQPPLQLAPALALLELSGLHQVGPRRTTRALQPVPLPAPAAAHPGGLR
ncbi:hypothetical protein FBY35_7016 [Streptomyces sp. SLBN-118]|uniref:DUF3445 domain-containing protein n=1 Tax=Streptomyces sp. SLBN-118 TaxID=2768454 RepID=UPI0011524574|nr:DUF3445 domain-containing protein [Streptomyces sp. SLBN-118]TQK45449.1 hypothetical protein FBY35_7016 [Streptomyces sp. SLBN-118]